MVFLRKKLFIVFLLILVLGGAFSSGYFFAKSNIKCEVCKPEDVNFSLFWESWKMLQENFVDKTKFDTQKMIYGAISGMVNSLEDPYTVFLSPEEKQRFIEDVDGSFGGIGIEIDARNGQLQVISPLEGTPAKAAGLRAGDKIIKINSTLTSDLTADEAVKLIRGEKGTDVTLTIGRDDWNEAKEIKITRDIIVVPSLKWEIKEVDGQQIVYFQLYQFSEKTGYDFNQAAAEILSSQSRKIILDLRNNPGGYLDVSQRIAGWFLKKGDTVVIEDYGAEREELKSEGPSRFLDYQIVVLINQGSASASEILAGALKDNRNIKLIGEKSFGKGSVQQMEDLSDGSALKITIAKWLTPNGNSISEKGLEPDIKVEMTEDDYKNDKDPQLDKAIEIIKNL